VSISTFKVRLVTDGDAKPLIDALLDVPTATAEEIARLELVEEGEDATFRVERTKDKDIQPPADETKPFLVGPKLEGIDLLRAAILQKALEASGASADRTRKAKRPYAVAIITTAALLAAAEGVLPGAAAFVVATQASAVASLHYLYTGKWMGRAHVLTLLPVFASEAAGGSVLLLVKSVLPPTGVGEVTAAIVAASLTIAMLGAIATLLEQGHTLDEKEKLREAFKRMNAKTKAERGRLLRERDRWKEKGFFRDLVRRMVFE
jgi:uncharacterized protein (DUF697 family)